jgi:hypothetical protein
VSSVDAPGLLDALAGRPADSVLEAAERCRRTRRDELLSAGLSAVAEWSPAVVRQLIGRLTALPPTSVSRIVDAPACWMATMLQPADPALLAAMLDRWLTAEEILLDPARRSTQPVWTALGDRRAGDADGDIVQPRTAGGAVIDWRSHHALDALPEVGGVATSFTPSDAARAVEGVLAGEAIIDASGPERARLVSSMTSVVVLRNDLGVAGFNSASTRLATRRPVLRNPHRPEARPPVVADALLHEAVHALVDLLECADPLILDPDGVAGRRLRSPWSGADLDVHTFIQACLVWYALVNLWLDALGHRAVPDDVAVEMLTSRSAGFASGPLSGRLRRYESALSPNAVALVDGAQERVNHLLVAR